MTAMTAQTVGDSRGPPGITRRLAAIAFADVAGYSHLIAQDEVQTLRSWKELRVGVIEPHMVRLGGRLAGSVGDGLFIEFPSVVNAVRWAADVQRSPMDPQGLKIRIGINVEDIIDDEGQLAGDGVNIAARIHQAADPGQIVVTETVRDFVASRLPVRFHDLGAPPLKNIMRPVHVFAVEWLSSETREPLEQPYLQWSSRPTIAILPFQAVGGADAYFGDGIANEIISGLSRNRSVFVIARSSTLRYRDRTTDLRHIAGELSVRYILDGSVQQAGNRLRISTELMDAAANRAIWTERYEGLAEDVFDFQDRIARTIVSSLAPRVLNAEVARIRNYPTPNLNAYHCLLKAHSQLYVFTEDSYREALELLERAIFLDPNYAQAYAYLAWWLNFRIGEGLSRQPDFDRARAMLISQRAIDLDRTDAFVLTVAAHILSFVGRKPADAIELFDQALQLDKNSAFAWGLSALTLAYLGLGDDAMERLQNVWRLDPFDPLIFYYWIVAGIAEFVAGRYNEAITWLNKSKRANPRFVACLRMLAASLALADRKAEAQTVASELLAIDPSFDISKFVAWYPLQRNSDLARLEAGLRASGLPG
jgi:TolB-like protein/class 3 adenylate cyclase